MPCAYQQLFGVDCPFCGGQRSVLLLLQGRFGESLRMFPALIPLVGTLFCIGHKRALKMMLVFDVVILIGSWILRLYLSHC